MSHVNTSLLTLLTKSHQHWLRRVRFLSYLCSNAGQVVVVVMMVMAVVIAVLLI